LYKCTGSCGSVITGIASEDDRVWLAAGRGARLGLWKPGPKEFGDEAGVQGDRSLYATDPEGNVVEAWDLFERDDATVHTLCQDE
jgi:hypothetical protein